MGINSPTWSYGKSKLVNASSSTVVNGDVDWSYGQSILFFEYITPTPITGMPIAVFLHHLRQQGIL